MGGEQCSALTNRQEQQTASLEERQKTRRLRGEPTWSKNRSGRSQTWVLRNHSLLTPEET